MSINNFEDKMKKVIANLQAEFTSIRAGRANPHMLDKITVEYFGANTPINQLANVTIPEARLIQIAPWDSTAIKNIEKAILVSDLGITPTNDGKVIRLLMPELTQERRNDIVKDVKKKGEEYKVTIRNVRREAIDFFKKQQKDSAITEDELKSSEDKVQKLTDKYISEIDKIVEEKNKEVLSI